ncbi:MAG: hypothetical protein SGPRY_014318, partial [Prymnesium sp.]
EGEVAELQRKLKLCEARVEQAESDLLAARADYEERTEEGRRAGLASKVVISRARWQAANASAEAEEAKEESERATFDAELRAREAQLESEWSQRYLSLDKQLQANITAARLLSSQAHHLLLHLPHSVC